MLEIVSLWQLTSMFMYVCYEFLGVYMYMHASVVMQVRL